MKIYRGLPALLALCWAPALLASADYQAFEPQAGAGTLHYFATPGLRQPRAALIVIHGHPRDALNTFEAASSAVGSAAQVLVVAPQFQVDAPAAARCTAAGVPQAQPGELLWTCRSWVEGEPAQGGTGITSYAVLDALVEHLHRRWPSLERVTVAGFSAGAQMVQRYIGYAAEPVPGLTLRYLVASPGSWLYFDNQRPTAAPGCANQNRWPYGLDATPPWLPRNAAQAREHYRVADVRYLVGAEDKGPGPGTSYRILDKSCAAMSQGPTRLERAEAFVADAGRQLKAARPPVLTVIPGCAHDVRCVLTAPAAHPALLGE